MPYAQLESEATQLVIEKGRLVRERNAYRAALERAQRALYEAYTDVSSTLVKGEFGC